MSQVIFNDAAMKQMIRAGATYPGVISSSYIQPSENPGPLGTHKQKIFSKSNRNNLPMPAFGATRDEGAVGPIESLSRYTDGINCILGRLRKPVNFIPSGCETATRSQQKTLANYVAKGPTADIIISMTAAGKKPPVPVKEQIERHEECLSKICRDLALAVSRQINDENKRVESVLFDVRNPNVLSDKIPGYRQTWGVAFSQEHFAP